FARRRIRNLIVVLNEGDKCVWGRAESRRAARCFLPEIGLSLKQITVLGCGNKFLRRAEKIAVVRFPSSGQCDDGAVMKIVVPNRIEIVAAFAPGTDQLGNLPLVFGDHNDRAWSTGFACGPANCA